MKDKTRVVLVGIGTGLAGILAWAHSKGLVLARPARAKILNITYQAVE